MNHKCRLFILLVLATVASSHLTPRNKLKEGFLKLIEKWRNGDVGSLPIALPQLPLKLAPNDYGYDGYKLSIAEAKIKGMEHMAVKKLAISNSSLIMYLKFEIPSVAVLSDWYRFQGRYMIFNIDNEGKFRSDIKNLQVSIKLKFGAQGSNTVIKKLALDFTMGGIKVNLSGCSNLVLSRVNDKVQSIVTLKSKYLMNGLKKRIINAVNVYLRGHTPDQLMQIISSF